MKKKFYLGLGLLAAFVGWTAAVCLIDVMPIGPNGSSVGFATLNAWVHQLTGVNRSLYRITDWLGLVPLATAVGFAILGLLQWIKRGRLIRVDRSVLILGGFYAIVATLFVFFEVFVVNYRPVLIDGVMEASYPSSTTMLVFTVMPTAMMQWSARIKSSALRRFVNVLTAAFVAFMVFARLLSGVHWVTDIVGGILLGSGMILLYDCLGNLKKGVSEES